MSDSVDHESMLMKPGATAMPFASIVCFRFRFREIAHAHDAIAAHGDIRAPRLRARAVVDGAAFDQEIERLFRPRTKEIAAAITSTAKIAERIISET